MQVEIVNKLITVISIKLQGVSSVWSELWVKKKTDKSEELVKVVKRVTK